MTRQPRQYLVLGFGSTHRALDAEALLEDMGIEVTPIPAPKALGPLCGIGLRVEPLDAERAELYLERAGIEITARTSIDDV